MHVGPRNSGKTSQALKKLQASNRGVYCGPIRLSAYEVWKRCLDEGLPCDLTTGEERIPAADYFADPKKFNSLESVDKGTSARRKKVNASPFSKRQQFASVTTEMLSLDALYDVAVIDEIQLLGDQQHGWAWTRALLGVQAHEVHLCGEASAVPIVQDICRELGEEVDVREYQMLSLLKPSSSSMRSYYSSLKEGDCFVTFSRNDIFKHKDAIERVTGMKCGLIYDQLPAETRAHQARLFNDPTSPYKVMVVTESVQMGLDLNIRRVVFESLEKVDGKRSSIMPVSQVKLIAGRASREVICFSHGTSGYLVSALNKPNSYLTQIGLQPEVDSLTLFAYRFPEDSMARLLIKYAALASLDSRYFLCFSKEQVRISTLICSLPLTIEDRFVFMAAPISPAIAQFAFKVAEAHAYRRPLHLSDLIVVPNISFTFVQPEYLEAFENAHRCIVLYLWLSSRFPFTLDDTETAKSLKATIEKRLEFMIPRVRLPDPNHPPAKDSPSQTTTKEA